MTREVRIVGWEGAESQTIVQIYGEVVQDVSSFNYSCGCFSDIVGPRRK